MKFVEGKVYAQLKAADDNTAEIAVIIPEGCGYSLAQLRDTVKASEAVRLFEVQDGERVYYDEQ